MPGPDRPVSEHPTRLRLTGLAGTTLMALGGYGAGALPGTASGHRGDPAPWPYWLGLAAWFAGLVVLAAAWWRLGASAPRPGRRPVPLRWLLVTGALWSAPLLLAPPLGSRDVYAYACQGALWLDGVDPYAVGVAEGGCPWTAAVPSLWWDTTTPYGPLAIALAGAVVALARLAATTPADQLLVATFLFRALALLGALLLAGYLPRLARACGAAPATAAWLALLSPLAAVHVVGGAHNDAVMVGLVVAALAVACGSDSGSGWVWGSVPRSGRSGLIPPRGTEPQTRTGLSALGTAPDTGADRWRARIGVLAARSGSPVTGPRRPVPWEPRGGAAEGRGGQRPLARGLGAAWARLLVAGVVVGLAVAGKDLLSGTLSNPYV